MTRNSREGKTTKCQGKEQVCCKSKREDFKGGQEGLKKAIFECKKPV